MSRGSRADPRAESRSAIHRAMIRGADGEHPLSTSGTTVLGRAETVDIVLVGRGTNTEHAAIVWDRGTSTYVIEDLDSVNGTFVNDVKVRGRHQLAQHDTIRFGTGKCTYRFETLQARVSKSVQWADAGPAVETDEMPSEDEEPQRPLHRGRHTNAVDARQRHRPQSASRRRHGRTSHDSLRRSKDPDSHQSHQRHASSPPPPSSRQAPRDYELRHDEQPRVSQRSRRQRIVVSDSVDSLFDGSADSAGSWDSNDDDDDDDGDSDMKPTESSHAAYERHPDPRGSSASARRSRNSSLQSRDLGERESSPRKQPRTPRGSRPQSSRRSGAHLAAPPQTGHVVHNTPKRPASNRPQAVRRASSVATPVTAPPERPKSARHRPVAYEVVWNDETPSPDDARQVSAAGVRTHRQGWDPKVQAARDFAGSARDLISPVPPPPASPSSSQLPQWMGDMLETVGVGAARSEHMVQECIRQLQEVFLRLEAQPPQGLGEAFATSPRMLAAPPHLDPTMLIRRLSILDRGGGGATAETCGELIGQVTSTRYKLRGLVAALNQVPAEVAAYTKHVEAQISQRLRSDIASDIRAVEQLRVQEAEAVAARLDRLDAERAEKDATIAQLKKTALEDKGPAAAELHEIRAEAKRLTVALHACQDDLDKVLAERRVLQQRADTAERTAAADVGLRDATARLQAELTASTAIHRAEIGEAVRGSEAHRARADALERELASLRGVADRERDQLRIDKERLAGHLANLTQNLTDEREAHISFRADHDALQRLYNTREHDMVIKMESLKSEQSVQVAELRRQLATRDVAIADAQGRTSDLAEKLAAVSADHGESLRVAQREIDSLIEERSRALRAKEEPTVQSAARESVASHKDVGEAVAHELARQAEQHAVHELRYEAEQSALTRRLHAAEADRDVSKAEVERSRLSTKTVQRALDEARQELELRHGSRGST
eukprot:m.295457 g.295457  ORF g.295457 m.295457 type:complete len:954 (+) comp27177_c0_seq1:59-2920(+)